MSEGLVLRLPDNYKSLEELDDPTSSLACSLSVSLCMASVSLLSTTWQGAVHTDVLLLPHLLLQIGVVLGLLLLVGHVPDVVADGLLDSLVGLEPDLRVADHGCPDPAGLCPGGGAAPRTTKGQGILEMGSYPRQSRSIIHGRNPPDLGVK